MIMSSSAANVGTLKRRRSKIHSEWWGWVFAGPAILGFLIFTAGPMLVSLYLSFTDSRLGITGSWIGIENYTHILTVDVFFRISIRVTLLFVAMAVPVNLVTSFSVALLLNTDGLKGVRFFRTFVYLPSIVPAVATAFLWMWLLNPTRGLLNVMLNSIGIEGSQWIYGEASALPSLVMMAVWGIGANMVIYLAGLQGVPRSMYEAIEVDGGGVFTKFWFCTLPRMTPTIFFTLVMGIIGNLQAFFQAFMMTEGGPNNATLFYAYHIFRTAWANARMGQASALAWILFLVVMFLTAIVFLTSKKWVYYEGGENA